MKNNYIILDALNKLKEMCASSDVRKVSDIDALQRIFEDLNTAELDAKEEWTAMYGLLEKLKQEESTKRLQRRKRAKLDLSDSKEKNFDSVLPQVKQREDAVSSTPLYRVFLSKTTPKFELELELEKLISRIDDLRECRIDQLLRIITPITHAMQDEEIIKAAAGGSQRIRDSEAKRHKPC